MVRTFDYISAHVFHFISVFYSKRFLKHLSNDDIDIFLHSVALAILEAVLHRVHQNVTD